MLAAGPELTSIQCFATRLSGTLREAILAAALVDALQLRVQNTARLA